MKAVRLTRANGLNERVQGDAGSIRHLDDAEAEHLVNGLNMAVYAPEHDLHPDAPLEIPVVKREDGIEFPEKSAAVDVPDDFYEDRGPEDLTGFGEDLVVLTMPWVTHSKAKWIEWAVYKGCDPEQAAGMTKNELMGRYGERL
jgi:hypothetical protein